MQYEGMQSAPAVSSCYDNTSDQPAEEDRQRLRAKLLDGSLMHPLTGDDSTTSFTDLAHAIAICCGLPPTHATRTREAQLLAHEIGGNLQKHIVVVLCDGMGNNILEQHLDKDSFLRMNNDPSRMRAVFPATTPAALTTLATGTWPGQHGMPGWDLRDQKGCDFPGKPSSGVVQLRVLHKCETDMRSNKPAEEFGFTKDDMYVEPAWTSLGESDRHMHYINAYNGTNFTNWYQGPNSASVDTIPETAAETLGTPEGANDAIEFFKRGVDSVLAGVKEAEAKSWKSYTYLYTAHPDKHMHALGISHHEVAQVMKGLNLQLERMWAELQQFDVSCLVTADHGHITVDPADMVTLPSDVLECLEYANIGIHGKGRHAVFHCRCGRSTAFQKAWAKCPRLRQGFLLLTVEAASEEGLFGPEMPVPQVRPRLGDFIAVSLDSSTLVTPDEFSRWGTGPSSCCQGAHGSLTKGR